MANNICLKKKFLRFLFFIWLKKKDQTQFEKVAIVSAPQGLF
jgi:hypothetical protein